MSFAIETTLRVTAVLALALFVALVLRKQVPALRYCVWVSAFAVSLIAPLLLAVGPKAPIPAIPSVEAVSTFTAGRTVAKAAPSSKRAPAQKPIPYGATLVGVWLAGVGVFAVRMARAALRAQALRKSARPIDPSTNFGADFNDVRVAESDLAPVAMTLGILEPMILLPQHWRDWDEARRRAVLQHELAHVRRKDCLIQWLPQTVCALHWFNPLAWIARAQMLCESERACDDAVVLGGWSGPQFARDLLDIAQFDGRKGADPMFVTIATRLERRISRLIDPSANRKPLSGAFAAGAVLAVTALFLPLAGVRAQQPAGAATLSGTVSDPSGAVISGAIINVLGPSGSSSLRTDPAGNWSVTGLAQGTYMVQIFAPGFTTASIVQDVTSPGESKFNTRLTVGNAVFSVNVTAKGTPRAAAAGVPAQSPKPKPIRVGGMVQAVKLISKTDPVYPDALRQQGVEGTVLINAIVGKTGNVLDAQVAPFASIGAGPGGRGPGPGATFVPPEMVEAALAAVRTWQYEPALLNGEPIEVLTHVTVSFKLNP
jgi:beta-lactamase regulating signal transducer with metallopeptidase domain